MEERPEVDFCVTMLCNFVSDDIGPRRVRDPRLLEPMAGFSPTTLMVRRSTFERIGLFDPARTHSDDTEGLLRAQAAGVVHELLPQVLARRRLHDSNLSQQRGADSRDEYLHLIKAMLDRRRGRSSNAAGDE
jgi:hypothetical protein